MSTSDGSPESRAAKTSEELNRRLRFRRSLRELSSLPPIPPSLLSLDPEPKTGAIDAGRVDSGWLHLWTPIGQWPDPWRAIYRQDLLAVFPSQRKPEPAGIEEVALCSGVFRCPRKGFRLEERSCLFYCQGICALATLQRRADAPDPSLSPSALSYYLGISRQRASLLSSRARAYVERGVRSKRGFRELCPPGARGASASRPGG